MKEKDFILLRQRPNKRPGLVVFSRSYDAIGGEARVVARADGSAPRAIHVFADGGAVVEPRIGDYIIFASHYRLDFRIEIYRLVAIHEDHECAGYYGYGDIQAVAEYRDSEWSTQPPDCLQEAINEAEQAAVCVHCTHAHYVQR